MSSQQAEAPYPPSVATLGGAPSIIPDIPISAVFLFLFVCSAATNMTIFQINRRRGHKFVISGVLFGFSMARITTLVLRIVWATRPNNVRLSLAATIFVNAGVLLVYIINLLFAQRILRAKQPHWGWHGSLRVLFRVLYVGIGAALVMVIVSVVLNAYTPDTDMYRKTACRNVQLASTTYLLVVAALPALLLAAAYVAPQHPEEETFGKGEMKTKVATLSLSTAIAILIAGFKTGTSWSPPRPVSQPAWFDSKPAFYIFVFTLELLVILLFVTLRVDQRFHIPNGSKQAGDYSRGRDERPKDEAASTE